MKFKPLFILSLGAILALSSCATKKNAASLKSSELLTTIDRNFAKASAQYKVMMKNLAPDRFPKTYYPDKYKFETSNSGWWCSGFYPGTLFYLYQQTKDEVLYQEGLRILKVLEKERYNTTTHDLGFMMYCAFGNANQIKASNENKEILVKSAQSLATRYNDKTKTIRSWDTKDPAEFKVIIDNMMNLELLFYATRVTGDSSYYKIAINHANTTMANHFRPDYSSYHLIIYDGNTGEVRKKKTVQGYSDSSAWARGQGWALYGYTVMYRETKDPKYLEMANKVAKFILNHPNLPKNKIPYWDFNAPDIPASPRDASAGALIASALLELAGYNRAETADRYIRDAEVILTSLSSADYFASPGSNGGFILKHSVGHLPVKSEVDVPLTYADYYFVEAMKRYKEIKKR